MTGHKKFYIFFISLISFALGVNAQTQDSYEYQSEFTWGINKNTFGGLIGGFAFKKARKLDERTLESFGLEIMNVKHPQEVRQSATESGNFFILGKSNYLYALRFQYGRDLIVFKKAPQQGVEIKLVGAVGPSIGVLAPYYVERKADQVSIREQYNPTIETGKILGPGGLFEGIEESKLKLGMNLKAAVNFELGTTKNQVTGFEAGFLLDAYTSKIILIPTAKNYSAFPVLFFTLFYGGRK
jgi:hypothetical protein